MKRAAATVVLSLLSSQPAPCQHPTPEQVRAELGAVCQRLRQGYNPFFGTAVLEDLRRALAVPGLEPRRAIGLRGRLARELLRLGEQRQAVALLEEARAMAAEAELAPDSYLQRGLYTNLAIAHLQWGERQNCVANHSARSCILPVAREAVHALPEHARRAGDLYAEYLEMQPGDIQARWLLNVSRMLTDDHPEGVPEEHRLPSDIFQGPRFPEWRDRGQELGVSPFDLGGGAVMDDFDGDGFLDLVSSTWDPCDHVKAFRNDGHGGFEEVSGDWLLDSQLGAFNLVQGDYDNDGDLDLLALRGGWLGRDGEIRNSLLRNDLDQEGGFVDVSAAAGVAFPAYPTQTGAWADYDGDGDLDFFVGNEATASSVDPLELSGNTGRAYPSQLFRNNGNGTFTDVARQAGVTNLRFAKAAVWGDYDDDGDPDLFVSNIGPNRLYRNEGDGTFTDVAETLGVTDPRGLSFTSWFFDHDNDGDLDLLVSRYSSQVVEISASYFGLPTAPGQPALFRNEGGRFREVAAEMGLERPLLVMGANFGDLDNDGWLDLYFGTGVPEYDALMPNVMYRSLAGGSFQDVTFSGGFGHLQKGHGVAFGDLDNDGDQDLYQQLGGAFPYEAYGNALYENPGEGENTWITLQLEGRRNNRAAIGARIEVRLRQGSQLRSIHRLVGGGGSFGGSSLQQEIGLGTAESIEAILVRWPGDGPPQEITGVDPGRAYRVIEGSPEPVPLDRPLIRLGAGDGHHVHEERQP